MIIDTSAIMAILLQEEDSEAFLDALLRTYLRRMSGVTFVELTIAADRRDNPIPTELAEEFVENAKITIEPVTLDQIHWARVAHQKYGRGHHEAALNFGDCFAYALAKASGEPLLFKGDDFTKTDIMRAI